MRLFAFERKKLFRMAGIRNLCVVSLCLLFLFTLFGGLAETEESNAQTYREKYADNLSYVIRTAERNLLEYHGDSYLAQYQQDVIERYSALLEKGITPQKIRGWDAYFNFAADDLFLFLLAILVSAALTLTERDHGTYLLLRITPNGRKCMWKKTEVFAAAAIVLPVSVAGMTLAGVAARFGLSSPFVPICSVERFAYCPYDLSIFGCLAFSIGIKILTVFSLMLFVSWVANIFKSYLVTFVSGGALLIGGYWLSLLKTGDNWLYLNPYTLGTTDVLWERYRSLPVFGASVPMMIVVMASLLVACTIFSILLLLGNGWRTEIAVFSVMERKLLKLIRTVKERIFAVLPQRKARRHSLLYTEAKKSFIKSHLLVLCILMLGCKCIYAKSTAPRADYAEEYYQTVCEEMTGELTVEKRMQIQNKLDACTSVIAQYDSIRDAMQNGMISREAYDEYIKQYDLACLDQYVYEKLQQQCARIDRAAERGIQANILYDTGWIAFFERRADVLLWAFLLLFFCGIYTAEYRNGFERIARTIEGGMRSLHRAKMQLAAFVTVGAFLCFLAIDLYFLFHAYSFPNSGFSLAGLMEGSIDISIWVAMLLSLLVDLLFAAVLSISVCVASRFCKRTYLTLPIGAVLFFLAVSLRSIIAPF